MTARGIYTGTQTSTATTVVLLNPWITGQAESGYPTALVGKYIYYRDINNTDGPAFLVKQVWKPSQTDCVSPQCSKTIAPAPDPIYPTNMVLIDPIVNSGVDFSGYPAQEACRLKGGRLPTMAELFAIYAGKVAGRYGAFDTNQNYSYWSTTDRNTPTVWTVDFSIGQLWMNNKNLSGSTRCVK